MSRKYGYALRNARLEANGFESYAAYLESPPWKAKRARVLKEARGLCRFCKNPATAVHHTYYSNAVLFRRSVRKLVAVCDRCHNFLEFDESGRKCSPKQARARRRILRKHLKQQAVAVTSQKEERAADSPTRHQPGNTGSNGRKSP